MKATIFGGNGYLGKHMAYFLNKLGWEIVVYDMQEKFTGDFVVTYFSIDISKKSEIERIDFNTDFIFYFIGLTGTDVSFDKYEEFISINEIGFLSLLNELRKTQKTPKLIFPSTRLVYKGSKVELSEEAEKEFKTIYAASKYNGELYLKMYKNLFNFRYTIFRICIPYGNLFEKSSYGTVSFFLERALNNQAITIYGDGSLKRTFTHVLDICTQILDVAKQSISDGECYNIGGETYSLNEVANYFGNKYGVKVQHVVWPEKTLLIESGDTVFNSDKIKSLLGSPPEFNLKKWINL